MEENCWLSVEIIDIQNRVQHLEEATAYQEVINVSNTRQNFEGIDADTEFFNNIVELVVFGPDDLEIGSNVKVIYSINPEKTTATVIELLEDKVIIRFHDTGRRSWWAYHNVLRID